MFIITGGPNRYCIKYARGVRGIRGMPHWSFHHFLSNMKLCPLQQGRPQGGAGQGQGRRERGARQQEGGGEGRARQGGYAADDSILTYFFLCFAKTCLSSYVCNQFSCYKLKGMLYKVTKIFMLSASNISDMGYW
jgi:hypothetical protein